MAAETPKAFAVGETVWIPYKELLDLYGREALALYIEDAPRQGTIVGVDWGPNSRHRGIHFPGWFYHVTWENRNPWIKVPEETLKQWQHRPPQR